jgi:hypothetical protein
MGIFEWIICIWMMAIGAIMVLTIIGCLGFLAITCIWGIYRGSL